MRVPWTLVLCTLLVAEGSLAQTLQHRTLSTPEAPVAPASSTRPADARQALPTAAEGEYRWGETGEVIELYVENGQLRGYLTRRSERDHAESAPMTFAFEDARATGQTLSFSTRHIHGDWYSFQGQVARGPATNPRMDGYYLLQGTLSIHVGAPAVGEEPLTRQVSLKLTASRRPAG